MASRDQSPAAWRNLPIPCALSCKMDQIGGGVLQRKPQQISDFGSVEVDILLVSFRHMPFFPKFLMFLHTGWWTITLKNLYCLILSVKMECFTYFCIHSYLFTNVFPLHCFTASPKVLDPLAGVGSSIGPGLYPMSFSCVSNPLA